MRRIPRQTGTFEIDGYWWRLGGGSNAGSLKEDRIYDRLTEGWRQKKRRNRGEGNKIKLNRILLKL